MEKLFLLDAYALIFRAYYALIRVPRMTRGGFNTSAVFGFVNTLEELLRRENPGHIAVCFDPPGPTFRNEAFEDYKAERAETPEDIKLSIPYIKQIIEAYGIRIVEVAGFEADDVIGTLAKQGEREGYTSYMMSPDKDFGQLVSANVLQYKPSYRGQDMEIRGEKEVCERYGLQNTRQVIDLLALMGDKIDNIPGCPGVGKKTAVKLIGEFGSVENLIQHTDTLKGALRKKIEDNTKQIEFSKFLATIRTDVPVGVTPADLVRRPVDRDKLFAVFGELEFNTLAERVRRRLDAAEAPGAATPVTAARAKTDVAPSLFDDGDFEDNAAADVPGAVSADFDSVDYVNVDNREALAAMSKALAIVTRCGLFVYAEGENDAMSRFVGAAVAADTGKAFYVPATYEDGVAVLLDLMARADVEKVTANAKRDYVVAARLRADQEVALDNFYDLALANYVLQPEQRHTIENLSEAYLGFSPAPLPVTPSKKGARPVEPAECKDAVCRRADISLRLYEPICTAVEKGGMNALLHDIELPLVPVLADMELVGVRIDTAALKAAENEMNARLADIEKEIYTLAGCEFNIGSPSQVGEVLFDRLQLDAKAKKTKTGQYSTSEDILEKLVPKHPVVAKIMEYRALRKLLSTYVTALPAAINPETGRVHTNYNQTVTVTGRLSSSAPNLQNIPVRDDEGREIRRAFIAEPGCLFLSADYSQIELRLLADFSGDEIMIDAFRNGKDIHAITASKIYHKRLEEVTSGERRHAKTANFGIVYGISAFGLSTRLGIPRGEAKEIIDNYFATFPTVRKYMDDSIRHAHETGYVETRMGRRRMLADINSRNPTVRGYAERNAINAPLQGTAADIIKIAMIRIYGEMRERGLKSKMIMQVHDELNFNVVEEELGVMQELVSRQMERAYNGRVTLTAGSGVATNWLDAH